MTTEDYIADARAVHGDKYDYSLVDYKGALERVKIICPEHGVFEQVASRHICGAGCPKCYRDFTKSSKEAFIAKCRELYGDRYDYSKVEYVSSKTKVCIICPDHGEFWMSPNNHMRGHGCPSCYGTPKKTRESFIREARTVHGYKFDYSKVVYNDNKGKVCIICPEHGEFWQTAGTHLRGYGCPACSGMQRITEDVFFERAPKIHNGKYDYSKVHFCSPKDFVTIICPEHGEFRQRASIHLRGYGCPKCGGSMRLTTEEFIEKAKKVHGDKYGYSKTNYYNTYKKVCITCPEHGDFWQVPNNHLLGAGCPKCAGKYNDLPFFIERARKVHGDKYDYSKVEYFRSDAKVCIICPKHGEFWQTPSSHMQGQGCPACSQSHLEGDIMKLLKKNDIKFQAEKSFEWLRSENPMHLDFFLPDYGVAIECQGGQHFFSVDYYGGDKVFKETKKRDLLKEKLCGEHGITVLYYSDLGIAYPYPVIENPTILLGAIYSNGTLDNSKWQDPELPFEY